jgi:hypothetical protein
VIVSAGAGCTANASIDDGSFDPDGEAITLSQSPPGPYPPGTNLVTLTATDSRNTSDSCSARVIVRDTTPPQITCPRDITVEFTDANGTTVSFAPSASDDCSGPPAIVCLPASGSTFPIGITAVACTATDRAGNSAGCAFWVTVLGARGVKQHVLAELTALRAGLPHSGAPASQELDAAIRSLAASLAPRFWVDETHLNQLCGGLAMTEEAMAVGEMQELLRSKHNPVPAEALMGLSGRIVRSDRLLAVVAVRDATATGLGPEPLRRAGAELAKGDAAALAGRYAEAIEHYHAAWTWAQRPRSLAGRDKD